MKIQEETIELLGHRLHHLALHPETSSNHTLIFFHGQGDYIDRYPDILRPFTDAGFTCLLTDLPGHGRSCGKRGHVPGLAIIDEILTYSVKNLKGSVSLAGHSMGGLMALRILLNHPDRFQGAWFSSPLLDPMHQAKPWMKKVLPYLEPLFPRLTVSTGVKSEDCRDDAAQAQTQTQPSSTKLYHSRISLSWGRTLDLVSAAVLENFDHLPAATRLLFTQGTEDPICPSEFLREHLKRVSHPALSHEEISGARHEPFVGLSGEEFENRLSSWLSLQS